MLLNCLTLAIGSIVWLSLQHGKFPRKRPGDPESGQALGLLFVPIFNIFWAFFSFHRLLTRINEQRSCWGLPGLRLGLLVTGFIILSFIPVVGFVINWLVVAPVLVTAFQSGANALATVTSSGRRADAAEAWRASRLAQRQLFLAWGSYFGLLGTLYAAVIGYVLFVAQKGEVDAFAVFIIHLALFAVPALLAGAMSFVRVAQLGSHSGESQNYPNSRESPWELDRRRRLVCRVVWIVYLIVAYGVVGSCLLHMASGRSSSYFYNEVVVPAVVLGVASVVILAGLIWDMVGLRSEDWDVPTP